MAIIALAIPFIVTALFVSSQFDMKIYQVLTWNHILNNHLVWLWSFAVACIPTILVIGLGVAHGVEQELPQEAAVKDHKTEAFGLIAQAHRSNVWMYPPVLVEKMGGKITEAEATGYLSEWYGGLPKRPGVKPKEEREWLEAMGQPVTNGHNGKG